MRRLFALAALSVALFGAAACNDSSNPSASGTTPTGQASPTGGTSSGDNTKEVCAAAEKVITDGTTKFTTELTNAMTAASSGNAEAANQAIAALKTLFSEWVQGLRAEASKATNAELKASLTTFADELQGAADKIKTAQDLQTLENFETAEMTQASDALDRICG